VGDDVIAQLVEIRHGALPNGRRLVLDRLQRIIPRADDPEPANGHLGDPDMDHAVIRHRVVDGQLDRLVAARLIGLFQRFLGFLDVVRRPVGTEERIDGAFDRRLVEHRIAVDRIFLDVIFRGGRPGFR
jgi:hypothetical protein